jgi:Holliday junction resolvase RusA-like endonuclease
MILDLKEPVGVNRLYLKGRIISPKYKAWIKDAGWELLLQGAQKHPIHGPYTVLLELYESTRVDADACAKGLLDLLVKHKITDDDRHCKRIIAEKTGTTKGRCRVTIEEWRPT